LSDGDGSNQPGHKQKKSNSTPTPSSSSSSRNTSDTKYESKQSKHGKDNDILQKILAGQDSIMTSLAAIEHKLRTRETVQAKTEEKLTEMDNRQREMDQAISQLTNKLNALERKQRERNLRLVGVEERRGEDCHQLVMSILNRELCMNPIIEVAHRTGRYNHSHPRQIIFRASSIHAKTEILRRQHECLRHLPYFIVEDLTKMDYELKKSLKPEMDRARREGKRVKFVNGSLQIEGENSRYAQRNQRGSPSDRYPMTQRNQRGAPTDHYPMPQFKSQDRNHPDPDYRERLIKGTSTVESIHRSSPPRAPAPPQSQQQMTSTH
jgi:archaellum component FlaC